jgi:dihydroorotase
MVQPLLIKGGRIIDPGRGVDETGSLLVGADGILWQGRGEETPPSRSDYGVLNAHGLIVCPGFIDLHCHLRQPGFESKETIATGTKAAARGGFTTVCCMPNTEPPLDSRDTIEYVRKMADKEGVIRVLPVGCVSKGRRGEELAPLPELASLGVVGFSDDGSPVYDSEVMRRALELSRDLGLPIINHCEDTGLSGDGVINEGAVSERLGLRGIPAAAEENMVARDIELAAITGGWVHIAHVSTAGSVELIRRAKAEGIRVTAEVTPHHLTLTEEKVIDCGTLAKVNPPLRTENDTYALVEGLNDKTIDIIATDHAPHNKADKEGDMNGAAFGISGFETAPGSMMSLVHNGDITLHTLVSRLTCQPARILGERRGITGTLAIGAPADIVIYDPDKEWVVNPEEFVSKGKNTPLAGTTLRGKVIATIFSGEILYIDDSVIIE